MTQEQIKALQAILAKNSALTPYWSGSPYVAETGSGDIFNDEYSDSAVLEVPLSKISIREMYLVEMHNAESLINDELAIIARE